MKCPTVSQSIIGSLWWTFSVLSHCRWTGACFFFLYFFLGGGGGGERRTQTGNRPAAYSSCQRKRCVLEGTTGYKTTVDNVPDFHSRSILHRPQSTLTQNVKPEILCTMGTTQSDRGTPVARYANSQIVFELWMWRRSLPSLINGPGNMNWRWRQPSEWCYQGSPRLQKCWQEQGQTTVKLKSALFWDNTKRVMVITDVSVQPIGPTLKDTSVRKYHYTLRNISEEGTSHHTYIASYAWNHESYVHYGLLLHGKRSDWLVQEMKHPS